MIIALLALAFAMILGGLLSVFFGWDIVLVERGWTMVLAGTISAASGALLLGITAALSRLAGIHDELARLQGGFAAEPHSSRIHDEPRASTGLSLAALSGGLLGGRALGKAEAATEEHKPEPLPSFADGDESDLEVEKVDERSSAAKAYESVVPFPSRPPADSAPVRTEEDIPEIKVPDFLIVDRHEETEIEVPVPDRDKDLFVAGPIADEPEEEARDEERTEPAEAPEEARKEVETEFVEEEKAPEDVAPAEPRPATVVGTYNSGDNKYVMFSDGSIEAQTPNGVFRFKSLDELKEFIASGGEGGSAAAI